MTFAQLTEPVVQLTQADWDRHGEVLAERHPKVHWLIVNADTLSLDGVDIGWDDARPTIVWFGFDGLRSPAQRRHFELARQCESVGYALTSYAGLDNEYWASLQSRGVVLTNAHLSGVPISQFVLARVLEWYHRPDTLASTRAERSWRSQAYPEIEGSTWLIVGLGAIGSNIAKRAKAFGAHIIGVRRHPDGSETVADETATPDQTLGLVGRADVVVFAVPESDSTRDFVDSEFLAKMKSTAALVNVGRGSLVVEEDLLSALDDGRLAMAILDVTREEPLPGDSWLWDHPKVMLSPHTSAAGVHRHNRSRDLFSDNLSRIANGQPPRMLYV